MAASSRMVVGIDETWTVSDQAQDGIREVKYTVDAAGTELLVYRDGLARHVLARDRVAAGLVRTAALLPRTWRTRIARLASSAGRARVRTRECVHRAVASVRSLPDDVVVVGRTLRPYLAHRVDVPDVAGEQEHQRAAVVRKLREAGIPVAVVPGGAGRREVVVVPEEERDRLCAVLARRLGPAWYVVPLDHERAAPRRPSVRRLQRMCARSDGFRLFRYVAGGADRELTGAAIGCDVEVWRSPRPALLGTLPGRPLMTPATAPHLIAPRRNTWVTRLSPEGWEVAGTRPDASIDVGPYPHLLDVVEPVDLVYTWVDGSDPAWLAAKQEALGGAVDDLDPAALDEARFRSRDELRYSLRSVEMFAPWVRRIHLVTAGQVPDWLDVDHPRIRLVDHRDLFADPSVLPVFNSHAIESQLHRIPGLTEQYVYMNDDVFFGRPVGPELFFHGNGLAKFFPSTAVIGLGPRHPDDPPVVSAAKNNRLLVEQAFGRTVTHQFQHAPHPQLRSVLEEMERTWPEDFARVAASKFRHPEDLSIASSLHHYVAYARGKAVPGRLEYLYLDLVHPQAARRLTRLLTRRDHDVFCLNDTVTSPAEAARQAELLEHFLTRYFPVPSSFERTDRKTR